MEMDHVNEFVVLATEGTFRGAARRLNLSQASLDRHLGKLERAIGAKLVDRNRNGITLTAAGTAFLSEARALIDLQQRVTRLTQRVADGADAYLNVGHIGAGTDVLQTAITAMLGSHPHLKLTVSEHTSRVGLDMLTGGEIDLLLTRPPIHDESVEETWLRDDLLVVALPARHPATRQPHVDFDQLSQDTLIMPAAAHAPGAHAAVAALCREHQLTCESRLQVADLSSLLLLVGAGCGYGLIPASTARCHKDPSVHTLPLKSHQPAIPIHIAWRRNDSRPALSDFRQALLHATHRTD